MSDKNLDLSEDNNNDAKNNSENDFDLDSILKECKTSQSNEIEEDSQSTWKFDAQAPTLSNNIEMDGGFEIDIPAPAKAISESSTQKPTQPSSSNDGGVKAKATNKDTGKFILAGVITAVVIAVLAVLGTMYYTVPNSNEKLNPGNVALTVGEEKVSIGMYNYYYSTIVNNYINYAGYGYYDLDTAKDYSKQMTTDKKGNKVSWAQLFVDDTKDQIQYITSYYEKGVAAGVTLTKTQKEGIDSQIKSLKDSASEAKLSLDEYISQSYGEYCGEATLRKMLEQCYVAENYYQQSQVETKATSDEVNAYFKKNKDKYQEVSFAFLQVPYDSSKKGDKDKVKKQAEEYAKQIDSVSTMKKMVPTVCADLIDSYVAQGYFEDKDSCAQTLAGSVETTITKSDKTFGTKTVDWLFNDSTKLDDCSVFDSEENSMFLIVLKTGTPKLQDDEVYSVRHILVTPTSSKTDDSNSSNSSQTTTYTKAEWAEAKKKADEILAKYNSGEKTEYQFALLAESDSADTESTSKGQSGLYGGLYAGTKLGKMVPSFEKWSIDDSRKYGDTGIVKTEYGYHIMYFVEKCKDYYAQCEKEVISEKEKSIVSDCTVKEHKVAMKKTTKATPEKETTTQQQDTTSAQSQQQDTTDAQSKE